MSFLRPAPPSSEIDREIERRRQQQTALAELAQVALTGIDIDLLVGQTCALIESVIACAYCSIVKHEESGDWKLCAGIGRNTSFLQCNETHPEHRVLLLYALLSGGPVVFENPARDPRLNCVHLAEAHDVEAGVSLPIPGREGSFGVLTVYDDHKRTYAPDEVEFLKSIADLTGAVICNAGDEAARREAETQRAASEDRFRALVENAADGIALVDAHGVFLYNGPSTKRILGYADDELLGRNFIDLVHPDDVKLALKRFRDILAGDRAEVRGELRLRHAGGSWRWIEGAYRNLLSHPAVRGIVVNYRDVTERKIAEQQLEQLAYRDTLTDLPNRFLFHDRLAHAIDQARRRNRGLALMYVDLDRFKVVNDTLGHTAGDRLLQIVGGRLRDALRADDTIARLGGDEFAVILPDMDRGEDAGRIARKLLATVREPMFIEGHELYITASIGISVFPSDGEDVGSLVKHADAALYRSKDLGRNTAQLFAPSMNARYSERLELELSLHRALERGELEVHYQPLFDRPTRRIRCLEALLRWNRPGIGMLVPDQFIDIAEETRLVLPIGEWVLREACAQLRRWRDMGLNGFHVTVNLSAHQIAQPGFIHLVHDALTGNGLEAADLELEITESAALQNLEWTLSVLDQLNSLGVRIAVDDFGTGQSSLVYLKRLPLQTLKVDREFLRDVRHNPQDAAILESIIYLGHSLGLYVIVEGVEREADLALLESQLCDGFQGYLFARPMAAQDVPSFMKSFSYPSFAIA